MARPVDDDREKVIEEAAREFVDARWRGEEPDVDEFVGQYPQLERQLRQRIQDIRQIDVLFDSLVQTDESDFAEAVSEPDLVGRTVGNFEMVEIIGRGGMGVVYLARDTKLKRSVAVKSMPTNLAGDSTAQMRFRREAELLASLNHPNIAVIHEIVEEDKSGYLVLEYVPGETLTERIAREPLTLEQALSIGKQIARAVSAAHKKGIVHRDLKPGNIKITPDGQVKVLDFGLAKPFLTEGKSSDITATQAGRVIGTPAYMSPEQARGESTDQRTDIWSFGCIMYQMLTGRLPFEGKTATDMLARIIEREPDWELLPEEAPENIRALLRCCLEKDPDKRLANITGVTTQINDALGRPLTAPVRVVSPRLKRVAMIAVAIFVVSLVAIGIWFAFVNQSPSREIRLVVLPFNNRGPAGQEWFTDGVGTEITDYLSRIYGLKVIAGYSAIQCKERRMNTREIARELEVDYILDGTVECKDPMDPNSALRIDLRLIDTSNDTQLPSKSFEGNRSQLFDLQRKVAEHVDFTLLDQDRTWSEYIPTNSTEAHNLVLRGKAARRATRSYEVAIPYYEKATECDPEYVNAWGALAWAHTHIYAFTDPSPKRLAAAEYAAMRALDLLPDHPYVRLVVARYYYQGPGDYETALKHLERARELHPNHKSVLLWTSYIQSRKGDFDAVLASQKRVYELDPLDGNHALHVGNTLKHVRRYEEAEQYHTSAILRDPNNDWYCIQKAWLYLVWKDDPNEARDVLDQFVTRTKKPEDVRRLTVLIDICEGKYQDALDRLSLVDDAEIEPNWDMPYVLRRAEVYGHLGQNELARKQYESARAALEDKVREYPMEAYYHSSLGIAYAGLGDEPNAIEHGERGKELVPIEEDAWGGPLHVEHLARIYVMVGRHEEAIDTLKELLDIPSRLSHKLIAIDPVWAPLHNYPSFQKLIKPEEFPANQ